MATFKNFDALIKDINKNIIPDIQENEVLEEVKDRYQDNINKDIYGSYSPSKYGRRMSLLDENNIVGEVVNGVLEVRNIATPNDSIAQPKTPYKPTIDNQFISWIENGEVYNGKAKYLFNGDMSGQPWANPRPSTQSTIDDLNTNKQHIKPLKEGFKRHGFKIE